MLRYITVILIIISATVRAGKKLKKKKIKFVSLCLTKSLNIQLEMLKFSMLMFIEIFHNRKVKLMPFHFD